MRPCALRVACSNMGIIKKATLVLFLGATPALAARTGAQATVQDVGVPHGVPPQQTIFQAGDLSMPQW